MLAGYYISKVRRREVKMRQRDPIAHSVREIAPTNNALVNFHIVDVVIH